MPIVHVALGPQDTWLCSTNFWRNILCSCLISCFEWLKHYYICRNNDKYILDSPANILKGLKITTKMTEEEDSSKEHAQIVEYLAQNKVLLKVGSSKKRFIHSSFSFFQELLAEEPSVFKSVVQKIKKSSKYEQISLEDISGEDKVVRKKGNIYRESKTNKLIFQHEELNSTRCPQQNRWHHYQPESLSSFFFV